MPCCPGGWFCRKITSRFSPWTALHSRIRRSRVPVPCRLVRRHQVALGVPTLDLTDTHTIELPGVAA